MPKQEQNFLSSLSENYYHQLAEDLLHGDYDSQEHALQNLAVQYRSSCELALRAFLQNASNEALELIDLAVAIAMGNVSEGLTKDLEQILLEGTRSIVLTVLRQAKKKQYLLSPILRENLKQKHGATVARILDSF